MCVVWCGRCGRCVVSVCVCACGVVWCKSMRCVRCVVSVCSRVSLTPTLVTLGTSFWLMMSQYPSLHQNQPLTACCFTSRYMYLYNYVDIVIFVIIYMFLPYGEIGNHFCDLTLLLSSRLAENPGFCIFYAITIDPVEE